VRAAFERVAEIGFEGLRLRQVAEQAGIDHSTLHHYFATKQDLIAAVAEYTTRQFWATAPAATEPAAALREHLRSLQGLIETRPQLFAAAAELDLRARRDPLTAAALAAQERGWRELLVRVIGQLPAAGDPAAGAELVIAAAKGVRLAPELAGTVFARLAALLGVGSEGAS
jgi:AcrR family transcriptional regulator